MNEVIENGMVVGAEAAWDAKCEAHEYEEQWVKERAEEIRDNLKDGYGVAYEVDAVDVLGKILTLHMRGKHDEVHDSCQDYIWGYCVELARIQFNEADHDVHG